jgi:aminotransferase
MPSLSDKVLSIPPSGIREFFELVNCGDKDIISFGVGEPDFITPWHIREKSIYSIEDGYTTYTSNKGLKELREKISQTLFEDYGVFYSPEDEILITVGTSEALDLALRAIINPQDEVLIPQPCYVAYEPVSVLAGAKPKIIPLTETTEFKLTPEILSKYLTHKTKAIILSYPNNPTGVSYTKQELEELVKVLSSFDIFILSDEIYHHLTYDMVHTSMVSFKDLKRQVILLDGFSKAYAMTGWRIGYVASSKEIIQAMTKIHQYTILCAPIMSQYAALEALNNGKNAIEAMKKEYKKRRNYMVNRLNQLNLKCIMPKGAFYVFCNIKKTGLSSKEFAKRLFLEEKIATVPGDAFGAEGEGYIRLAYATSLDNIKEGLNRIERFLKKL